MKEMEAGILSSQLCTLSFNQELEKVMLGKNSDDDRKDFFIDIFKEEMGDYTGDRLDFYRKIMDKRIFPLVIESMYHSFSRKFR